MINMNNIIIHKIQNLINKILDNSIDFIDKLSIDELESIIDYTTTIYYNTSNTIISDNIFDLLIERLKKINPSSQILNKIGANPIIYNKIKLDYWMGSMNKIKEDSKELNNWCKKYSLPYIVSEKLDGVSALLIYDKNIKLYTRGNGIEGTNISKLLPYLEIPSIDTIQSYCNKHNIIGTINNIAFRGELIMQKDIYNKKWKEKFASARAAVSGTINSKKINITLAKDISLVLYEIVDPILSLNKQFEIIKDLKFNIVQYDIINTNLTYEMLIKYLEIFKKKSKYLIDGIIISVINYKRNTIGNPDYSFAFKISQNSVRAIVNNIEWNISKDGYFKPTIIIESVKINNITINRTTGYNAKYIVDNVIGKGAILDIELSGDVIPHIVKVIKPSDNNKPLLPKYKWKWNTTKVDILLDENDIDDNNDKNIKNIYHFFKFLKIKGLGEQTIKKLYNNGYTTISKILTISQTDLLEIKFIKEKTNNNIINHINQTKQILSNITLDKLIVASNKLGRGFGIERLKLLIYKFPNIIEMYNQLSLTDLHNTLLSIDGWNIKISQQFIDNFSNFLSFYKKLKNYIHTDFATIPKDKIVSTNIINKIFVFSGFRNTELEDLIVSKGGIVKLIISKKTDYLVVKDKSSTTNTKYKFAIENNISIIDIIELKLLISKNN